MKAKLMEKQKKRSALFDAQIVFRNAMLSFIVERLRLVYGKQWWDRGVERVFRDEDVQRWKEQYHRRNPKPSGKDHYSDDEFKEILDFNYFPNIFDGNWNNAFKQVLSNRNKFMVWLREVVAMRNQVAHPTSEDLTFDDAWRTLDTMSRLLMPIDQSAANKIHEIRIRLQEDINTESDHPSISKPLAKSTEELFIPKDSPLSLEQKNFLAKVIKESGRANTAYQKNALLEEIGLDPGRITSDKGTSWDFSLNLLGFLNRTRNKSALRKLIDVMRNTSKNEPGLKKIYIALKETNLLEKSAETYLGLRSLLAYPLEDTLIKLQPLDLGMIWGLNRGSFIGILAGWESDNIYQYLTYTEKILRNAQEQLTSTLSLPQRNWQILTFGDNPNQISKNQTIGVIINVEQGKIDSLDTIQNWCRSLINYISSDQQMAIIFHVITQGIRESRQEARKIYMALEQSDISLPINLLTLDYCPRSMIASQTLTKSEHFFEPRSSRGIHFCSWIKKAVEGKVVSSREIQKRYPLLIAAYRSIYQDDFGDNQEIISSTLEVVSDLDSLVPAYGHEIYAQFLELIATYLPQKLYHLIGSYATSSREEAHRCALIFSNKHRSDTLFDAWLKGIELNLDLVPKRRDLIADPETGSFVEGLVLALLRSYKRGISGVEEVLDKMRPNLTRSLKSVSDFYLTDTTEEEFLRDNTNKEFLLAIRAGTYFKLLHRFVKELTLDSTDLWWLLLANRPNINLVKVLLQQEIKKRVVCGLCSPEEWRNISQTWSVKGRIFDCRHGCRFYF
jgi:hypothetical protein